jgi:hypothetical protein
MKEPGLCAAAARRADCPTSTTSSSPGLRELGREVRGAVFVEFLIAFLPLYTFFLCLIQLALLFVVRVVTEHAAMNAARAAAVIVAEPRGREYRDAPNQIATRSSKRYVAVRNAALLSMSPLILNGNAANVEVVFPAPDRPNGPGRGFPLRWPPMTDNAVSKMRVRVEVDAVCRIGIANRIACMGGPLGFVIPSRKVSAEAIYPYQGARYE